MKHVEGFQYYQNNVENALFTLAEQTSRIVCHIINSEYQHLIRGVLSAGDEILGPRPTPGREEGHSRKICFSVFTWQCIECISNTTHFMDLHSLHPKLLGEPRPFAVYWLRHSLYLVFWSIFQQLFHSWNECISRQNVRSLYRNIMSCPEHCRINILSTKNCANAELRRVNPYL